MRLLLDTHAFVWWLTDDRRLGAEARQRIADERALVHVSAAVLWEIAIKSALGKLDVGSADLVAEIPANGFLELPMSGAHATAAGALPRHHEDPFDRMLIAQARLERLVIVTRNPVFSRYEVETLGT